MRQPIPQKGWYILFILGFVYKKVTPVPGKTDPEVQQEFLATYKKFKETKAHGNKIFFMDGVHPHYNSLPAYLWIEKGTMKELQTTQAESG